MTRATKKGVPKKSAGAKTQVGAAAKAELPIVAFATPEDWSSWLAAHHAASKGVWLKLGKKDSGLVSIDYAQALQVALSWGWIDGQKRAHDATAWLQRFTPRGPKSMWSQINRDKAMALIASGEMKPSGLAEVERARKDGRWAAAYASSSKAVVSPELQAALTANPRAEKFFTTLDSANRYAVLHRVNTATNEETRQRRITRLVEMLARHEKIHP
ncbi:bacteriocin-protection protein [Corallococcus sp. H22C18031201]|uniref:YdeI/OmpD-associated family protein n=1 Tax=Citreicoccus inhibens TaxID=2849499 RepID=UPI000E73695B|nr:YdeI/OmpD-associated family protein [Citreicoccus inhibens]MBU8896250.1 YdeI/OmpD-associated family protein [Citreicoccus inhibens]RJS17414.1 bacteriocin-protection protein [Corallococcus sp. H22C18031201]